MIWAEGHLLQSGKYRIQRQIGGGGFGLTYLAEDVHLQRWVVIKTPNRIFRHDGDYEGFVRRFQREGRVLAQLSHPHIVQVIEFFQEAGMPCLVMEYVNGETLNQVIQYRGYLLEKEAVPYFQKLAEALHTIHQKGIIHCDVHPGNIMLRNNKPILIDFGSAKLLKPSTLTVTTTVNENFAPYEQREGKPHATLDVYSLAATLYFAVTGQKPEPAVNRKMYGDLLKTPQENRSGLSNWLNQAILQGMALEAKDRPQSMQAWLKLLHPPQPAAPKPEPAGHQPTPSKNPPSRPRDATPKPALPWLSLGLLMLGYLPFGIVLGRGGVEALTWALAGALAGVLVLNWAWDWESALKFDLVSDWAWAWAWAWAWTLAWALAGALAGTGDGALALALTLALALSGALALALDWALSGALSGALSLVIGAITGYFSGIGIWAGLGAGGLAVFQFIAILEGINLSVDSLEHFRPLSKFMIWGTVSSLGLAMGGGLGWWLHQVGGRLPT